MEEQTINIPQLLLLLLVSGIAIRYFFFSPSSSASSSSNNVTSSISVRAREADVERIQQMFPQVTRRSIVWDLQRNGGNVVATTERVLSGRGLEVPPQSFQPAPPPPTTSSSSSTPTTQQSSRPFQPDLITRYNLKNKLSEESSSSSNTIGGEERKGQAWSQNKGERQALLQRRREEMILKARRKMEVRVAREAGMGDGGDVGSGS